MMCGTSSSSTLRATSTLWCALKNYREGGHRNGYGDTALGGPWEGEKEFLVSPAPELAPIHGSSCHWGGTKDPDHSEPTQSGILASTLFFFFHGSNVVPGAQHRFGPRRLVSWSSLQTWLCVYHGVQLGEMTVPSIDKAKGSELLCSPSTHPSREV